MRAFTVLSLLALAGCAVQPVVYEARPAYVAPPAVIYAPPVVVYPSYAPVYRYRCYHCR